MIGRRYIGLLMLGTFFSFSLFIIQPASANTFPPTPTKYFHGDANGDTRITGTDIIAHKNYLMSKPASYDTLQPQTSSQRWNTCDLDSDRACTGADLSLFNNVLLSKPISLGASPWVLQSLNLFSTGNIANKWTPFNINLYSNHLTQLKSGRPGISVVVEIDPNSSTTTGELKGRSCSPNTDDGRDQVAPSGAQCALAVTQTDWAVSPGVGVTESGAYGLQMMGDGPTGDLVLKIYTVANPALGIPATSLRMAVSFVDSEDQVNMDCHAYVDETAPITCALSNAEGTGLCSVGGGDTCGGSVDVDCLGPYTAPAQGEAVGLGTCIAEVAKGTTPYSRNITILEVNQNPSISVFCPGPVSPYLPTTCPITVSDADFPGQALYCSIGGGTTCYGVTLTGCSQANVPAQGEVPPGTCIVEVYVYDNFSPPGAGVDSDSFVVYD